MGESASALILAGDAHVPACGFACAGKPEAGADLDHAFERHHRGGHRPAAGAVLAGEFLIGTPAQALTCTEQRHCLEQIGLARAVVADEHHGALIEARRRPLVIAEIGQPQLLDKEPRLGASGFAHRLTCSPLAISAQGRPHTRIGMST